MQWLKLGAAAALVAAPVLAQDGTTAVANLTNIDGEPAGQATFTDVGEGVIVALEISGMPESQYVAVHIHENGECAVESAFESAGEHFNPSDVPHGYRAEGGPHAGDMTNQYSDAEGVLRGQIFNPLVRLDDESANIRGLAIVVHEMADDYGPEESGHAGDRIACGVIE
jgi:Cu-Zn family superoxide dismutase